jgi:hypothetical protein
MGSKILLVVVALATSVVLTACTSAPKSTTPAQPNETPPATTESSSPAAGSRLAPGLYELADGSAQAIGVLEYRDLEGGMWVLVGGTEAEGNPGQVVAVIANPSGFERELEQLKGQLVAATGTKADGASTRMAGPEIQIKTIEGIKDSGGAAE